MELSLNGSQVSLATRDNKRSPTSVQNVTYTYNRPRSAAISTIANKKNSHHQNHIQSDHQQKRPFSADSRLQPNILSSSFKVKNTNSSSTDILKLFPISKYWGDTKNSSEKLKSNDCLQSKLQLKSSKQMTSTGVSEESSVEDDIQTVKNLNGHCPADINDDDGCSVYNPINVNSKNNNNNKSNIINSSKDSINSLNSNLMKKQLHNAITTSKTGSSGGRFSYDCGEGKETNVRSPYGESKGDSSKMKYSSWISNNNVGSHKNLDLPGRVSFSPNDVLDVDYSDFDETNSSNSIDVNATPKTSRASVSISSLKSAQIQSSTPIAPNAKIYDKNLYQDSSMKAENTMPGYGGRAEYQQKEQKQPDGIYSHITNREDYNAVYYDRFSRDDQLLRKAIAEYPTNQVIEDYKKEIEDINRRHEMELHVAEQISPKRPLHEHSFNNLMGTSPNNSYMNKSMDNINNSNADSKSALGNSPKNDNVINDYYKSVNENEADGAVETNCNTMLNNMETMHQKLDKNSRANDLHNKLASTSPINKNLIKNTKAVNKKKNIDLVAPKKTKIREHMKVKSAGNAMNTNKSILRNSTASSQSDKMMKKSKSVGYIRQDSNLDEFQMDKVVSWMSINVDNFSEQGVGEDCNTKNSIDCNTMNKCYNKEWRETSNSKTDDEVNFSREDQRDSDSPYDEIVNVIHEIEHEKQSEMEFLALKSDVERKLNAILNAAAMTDPSVTDDEPDKLKALYTYLDKVETKCNETIRGQSPSEIEFDLYTDTIDDSPKLSDLLQLNKNQLAHHVITLSLRASELNKAILLSKEHVLKVRTEKIKSIRVESRNAQARMKEQTQHYEEIVLRHQSFIENLLKNKADLSEKIANLSRRLESTNLAWEHRLDTAVASAKENVAAGEKIRREKWVRENTKKIKDLTVKGLEKEINNMIAKHQKEICDLKCKAEQNILEAIEANKLKCVQFEKEIRNSYARDREGAIETERTAIRERFEKQMEDERKLFEKQKKRFQTEFDLEKERVITEFKEKENQMEYKKEQMLKEQQDLYERAQHDYKEQLKERELKHQNELSLIQEQFENDFMIWKRDYEKKVKLREMEKENAIRAQCHTDRDRQIDEIVAKMDAESIKAQQDFEYKMMRIQQKYEREINDLEISGNVHKEKYIDTRNKLGECETNVQTLESTVKQLEIQLQHAQKIQKDLKENTKKDMLDEMKKVQKDRDEEIKRIYTRVQEAIEKRDKALEVAQKENMTLKEKCIKMDAIIRQQREDYYSK